MFQSFFASLQGFLNCVVYGLSNSSIKRSYSYKKLVLFFVFSPLIVWYALFQYIKEKVVAWRERRKAQAKNFMKVGTGDEGNYYNALIADVADENNSSGGETEIVFGLSRKNLLASDSFYEEDGYG